MDDLLEIGDGFNLSDSDPKTSLETVSFGDKAKKNTGLQQGPIKPGSTIPVPSFRRNARVTSVQDGMTMGLPDRINAKIPGTNNQFTYKKLTGRRFKVFQERSNGRKLVGNVDL